MAIHVSWGEYNIIIMLFNSCTRLSEALDLS
jgi:hypothetical protein